MQMAIEEVQQGLLQQYAALTAKARALSRSTKDGIRSLARLWQLQVCSRSHFLLNFVEHLSTPHHSESVAAKASSTLCQHVGSLPAYLAVA